MLKQAYSKYSNLWILMGCLAAAFIFLLRFSITSSPLYSYEGLDQSVHKIIGKSWMQGVMPYAGLWDHKGPLVFLLNGIGYLFSADGRWGLVLLQTIFLGIFLFYVYKTFRLWTGTLPSSALTVVTLLWFTNSIYGGGNVEEWILPFLAAGLYLTLEWAIREQTAPAPFPPVAGLVHGMTLSIALLTRLTDALPSCGLMLVTGIVLLRRKGWKNLWQTVGCYTLGFLIPLIPFVIYFSLKGILADFWYATFTYNLLYASASGVTTPTFTLSDDFRYLILNGVATGTLLVSLFLLVFGKNRRHIFPWLGIASTLPLMVWLWGSARFTHYSTLCLPLFPLLVQLLQMRPIPKWCGCIAILALSLFPAYKTSLYLRNDLSEYRLYDSSVIASNLLEILPQEEIDKGILSYGIYTDLYLKMGVIPPCRHFFCLDWMVSFSESLKGEIVQQLEECDCGYILARDVADPEVRHVIEGRYTPCKRITRNWDNRSETLTLWRLKE